MKKLPKEPFKEPREESAKNLLPLTLPGAVGEWIPANPFPMSTTQHSFVSGKANSNLIRIQYFQNTRTNVFAGRAWFGPDAEGPPGHAHGGSQAALLDEGMGAAAWHAGNSVVAAKIEINFKSMLPIGTTLTLHAEVARVEGRKVFTRARLEADDGTIFSEGTGLFIVIDPDSFRSGAV